MDHLAKELNDILLSTPIYEMLSDYGKRMYVPKGIIVQSADAKKLATNYNATIGVATQDGIPMCIAPMRRFFSDDLTNPEIFSYAPMGGVLALRNKWKEDMIKKNPLLKGKNFSLPIVTAGLTSSLSLASSVFLDKDDTVIMPDMYWENYNLIFREQRQANVQTFPIFSGEGFNIKGMADLIEKDITGKVFIILNFPNNPTGYSPTNKESDEIVDLLVSYAEKGKKIIVLSDDAYFGLFFTEDVCRQSLFAKLCDAHKNILCIKGDAATKEEMAWGFRVAFLTYGSKGLTEEQYDALMKKTLGALRGAMSSCSHPAQSILLKGMNAVDYEQSKKAGIAEIERRFVQLKKVLKKYENETCLKVLPFNSGYFMSFQCKCNAEELRVYLLKEYGAGIIRIDEHHIRLAFSSTNIEKIEGLVDIVYKAAKHLC